MGGDYTRLSFDPTNDFSVVLKQQGRVALDADWNELVEILDRRLRAETIDIIGHCVVPKETPDGFIITADGGMLNIGPGRIYVDGILAENHGKPPLEEVDNVLKEIRSTTPLPYDEQPYFPNPPALPVGGPYIVYLDVWQREVTYIEEPDLLEKALGGPDTTTRLQTVWQVKVLGQGTVQSCDEQSDAWDRLVAAPAGRLSTAAVAPPASDDPCLISPNGGYRGVENRLYRVEIHAGGLLGEAKFKWSRDNGSVVTRVEQIATSGTQSALTVALIGRDKVLRFEVGDWVEVLDDLTELHGQAGHMAQVTSIDEANRIVTITPEVPGTFDASDPARHTRVRLWAQQNNVDANGLLDVTAGPIDLEDGIRVEFSIDPSQPDGEFKVGDYWVFAARTPDGSIEELDRALPRGIHHHYCRLALATFPDPNTGPAIVTDCRVLWPPDTAEAGCDCSVCVTAESHNNGTLTIQRAIDQVKAVGGKVCLGSGIYTLTTPVQISGAQSVHIQGHGWKTILVYLGVVLDDNGEPIPDERAAITIENSFGVTVEALTIITPPQATLGDRIIGGNPAVVLRNSLIATIQRCVLIQSGPRNGGEPAIAMGSALFETWIRENLLITSTGIGQQTRQDIPARQLPYLFTASLYVQDNTLWCTQRGISLGRNSLHFAQTRLSGNFLNGCSQGGITAVGTVFPGSPLDVQGNIIRAEGNGIVIGTDEARVSGNDVSAAVPNQEPNGEHHGIVLAPGLDPSGLDRCQVLGNRVTGLAGHGVAIRTHVRSAMIKQNIIESVGAGGIFMEGGSSAESLHVENNQLLHIAPQANDANRAVLGIGLLNTMHAQVANNTINGLGQGAVQNPSRVGIQVMASSSVRIANNEVVDVGPVDGFVGESAGIEVLAPFEQVDVGDNVIRQNQERPQVPIPGNWCALRIRKPTATVTVATPAGDTILFTPVETSVFTFSSSRLIVIPQRREFVTVRGNLMEAHGNTPAVDIAAGGACTFNDNRCFLAPQTAVPVVRLTTSAVIAHNNYVERIRSGLTAPVSIALDLPGAPNAPQGPFTIVGNITSADITVNGAPLSEPWAPLNVNIP